MSEPKWERLLSALGSSGISIKDVADAAGVAQSSIFRALNGQTKSPRPETVDKMEAAFVTLATGKINDYRSALTLYGFNPIKSKNEELASHMTSLNKTRKYFGTDGIRGRANTFPMTAEVAYRVGMAAGKMFMSSDDRRHLVVIGKDTRLSGYMIEPALVAGFTSVGMDVRLFGPLPTPGVAMMTRSMRADLGVMISASHNAFADNGIKLFGPDGYKLSDEVELAIEARMDGNILDGVAEPHQLGRVVRVDDAQSRYVEITKASFPRHLRLKGMRIVIDCAHGAAYKVAPLALYELGAEVFPIGVSPDGLNINNKCGSTYPQTMAEAVKTYRADIGIALDGDADRLVICDEKGQVIDGVVKNITDYGAFVDLGGIDGLLHVTDLSYKRVGHPSEMLNIGDTVKVQIIRINRDTQRISLGMKQLESDPWDGAGAKYPVGAKLSGRVTNITEYGAFVELEPGIEGLVHVSEMSWTKKNVHPGKIVSTSQEVEVVVLEVDEDKRRISLGLKQAQQNPWERFAEAHPVGTEVEGEVKNATEFGLFIGLDGDVDGMVHMSDIAWGISGEDALALHRKGEVVKAIVLAVEADKERISLGMKQLERGAPVAGGAAAAGGAGRVGKNEIVTVTVLEVRDAGLEVQTGDDGATGFIKRTDLGRDRDEQRPERFQVGQKFDAMVTGFDRSKKPTFSIKAMQIAEEKQAVAQYGSSDSGASLGDILGEALKARGEKN